MLYLLVIYVFADIFTKSKARRKPVYIIPILSVLDKEKFVVNRLLENSFNIFGAFIKEVIYKVLSSSSYDRLTSWATYSLTD
ncbi:hypothetical protein BDD30_2548 [Photorhabdus asymbiotica]|uniref:Transposase n=1 Tax=Photorhabdus asymbiotica TaxID=291112 RepID=A0ABX9SKX6_9GAMM|nr:hypothetical protein BDD30_2548 [Photorhabdus asymbiotica]